MSYMTENAPRTPHATIIDNLGSLDLYGSVVAIEIKWGYAETTVVYNDIILKRLPHNDLQQVSPL